ncbi:Gfo/Idh/MocA family protein [Butyrivibrio sp. LC3010]|uniref:Gfo/Idh/MocA family protein n=1 Tax=Butyrivibrio sp. LC3010 TaxID=1280680 RepID=UPI0004235635|nr:Gfo/Idh/MocA family oxidoreductase [Butyrivibrio sp. LC3010]
MIRIGIIGTGRIAGRAVNEIKEVEDLCLFSVFNPDKEHAEEFAKKYNIDHAYSDIDDFLESVDAIYIASPHGTHYEYARKALTKKKHVLCEKPMVLSGSEVRNLYEIAESNNIILMEAIKTAYCPGFQKLEEVVKSSAIGSVIDVEAAFTRLTDGNVRELTDITNGGAFTEFGSYTMLPIFRFLGTDYRQVFYHSIPVKHSEGVDGYTKAIFKYENKFATAKTGLTVKSEGQLLISGTLGYILVPSPWWLTRYFEVRHEDPKQIEKYECEFEGDGLRYEFKEFCKRISHDTGEIPKGVEHNNCHKDIEELLNREKCEAVARAEVFEKMLKDR